MELDAGKDIAHEENIYDEAFEMSEAVQPLNVRNKINPYAYVRDTQDRNEDLHRPQSIGYKRKDTRWIKGAAVVLVVNTVVLMAVIIFLGIREGIDQSPPKVDGEWSTWASWSECSASCGTGMAFRNRSCSYPKPSNGGDHCLGESAEYRLCNTFACPDQSSTKVDGRWSTWGWWSECSASCGIGMASRNRSCSNPKPSNGGDYCLGGSTEDQLCNRMSCPVAFNAREATDRSLDSEQVIVFKTVILNEGAAYNNATGVFTAPVDGLYQFNAQLCVLKGKDLDYGIRVHRTVIISGECRTTSDANDGKCFAFSAVGRVQKGETVEAFAGTNTNTEDILFENSNDWNSFSGVLISV